LDTFYKKIVEIDILQYINELDRCEEGYLDVMDNEVRPFTKTLPEESFSNLKDMDKLKYDLFLKGDFDLLIKLVGSERLYKMRIKELNAKNRSLRKQVNEQISENNALQRDNRKFKEEVKLIKTTRGWFAYKTKNIYQRISKKI
jgi:hypothetical protein